MIMLLLGKMLKKGINMIGVILVNCILKSLFRTIFRAYSQRQSTHQRCQCFDFGVCTKKYKGDQLFRGNMVHLNDLASFYLAMTVRAWQSHKFATAT